MSEVTFEPFQRVLVRDNNEQEWRASFYSHAKGHGHKCVNDFYLQCIPYNDETAHLLGTSNSPTPPELEFKPGEHIEVFSGAGEWNKAIYLQPDVNDKRKIVAWYAEGKDGFSASYAKARHADW